MPATETPTAPVPAATEVPKLIPKPEITARSSSEARGAAMSGWMQDVVGAGNTPDTLIEQSSKPAEVKPETNKPVEKSPEQKPFDTGEVDKWPRTAQDWQNFVKQRNEGYKKRDDELASIRAKLTENETRLTELSSGTRIDPKEHEMTKKERDALSEALRLAAVEQHPKFKAYYDGKENQQLELAKRLAGPDKAESIAALLKLPDSQYRQKQLGDLMLDMDPITVSRMGSVLNDLESVRSERTTEIARARDDYEKAITRQQQDQEASRTQARTSAEKLFNETLRSLQDPEKGVVLWQPRPEDSNWNDSIKARSEQAKHILFGQDNKPEELARHALNAASYPVLLESYKSALEENNKLQSQIKELQTATPSITTAPSNGTVPTTRQSKPGSRPMDVARDFMQGLQDTNQT